MLSHEMDERMIYIRGKGLLYGFLSLIILLGLKNFAIDLFSLQVESMARLDFAIIFVSVFVVTTYMLLNDGLLDIYTTRARYIFPASSLLFLGLIIASILSDGYSFDLNYISNIDTVIIEFIIVTIYSVLLIMKHQNLKNESKE